MVAVILVKLLCPDQLLVAELHGLYRSRQGVVLGRLCLFLALLLVAHLFLPQILLIHPFQSGMLRYRVL